MAFSGLSGKDDNPRLKLVENPTVILMANVSMIRVTMQ